ncbi:MAG: hypothetical protein AAGD13_19005 [Pseudomonadota bacterium]
MPHPMMRKTFETYRDFFVWLHPKLNTISWHARGKFKSHSGKAWRKFHYYSNNPNRFPKVRMVVLGKSYIKGDPYIRNIHGIAVQYSLKSLQKIGSELQHLQNQKLSQEWGVDIDTSHGAENDTEEFNQYDVLYGTMSLLAQTTVANNYSLHQRRVYAARQQHLFQNY